MNRTDPSTIGLILRTLGYILLALGVAYLFLHSGKSGIPVPTFR